jgi:uncharacterized delta-60 repeat protein
MGCSDGDFNGIDGTQSNNISSDATASGTDSLTNVTAYDNSPACPGPGSDCAIFQSIDTGTENLHLRTDADNDALNAGADLSANFTDDIDGDTRPVGANLWDIGADENMQFVTAAVSGTITASTTESDIVSGGKTIIITLTNDTWDADIGQDNAQTTALINGLDSDAGETNGWDAEVLDPVTGLDYTDVTRTSATVVTITLPAFADYNITADETITATVPASALVTSTSAVVAAPTFDVTFDPEITVGSSGTQVLTMAIPSDNQYLGGAFTMIRSAGSANVSEIVLSEISSVDANSDLSDVRLYYETAGTCTYDGDENLLGAGSFDSSEQATISGFVSATLTYDSSDSQQDHARSMVTDTSGNIYVAGFEQTTANGYDWVIRKYGANGDLCDGSGSCAGWGDSDSGQITHNSGGSRNDKAHAIAIDSTNAIYVAGYIGTVSNGDDWAIRKYDASGDLDTTWGTSDGDGIDGQVSWNSTGTDMDIAYAIAIDSTKAIYVGGLQFSGGATDWAIHKYGPDGDLCDSSGTCNEGWGGGGGIVTYGPGTGATVHAIAIDSDKAIYVAGYQGTNGYDWAIRKYGSDGDLCDGSGTCSEGWGGGDGTITYDSGGSNWDWAYAITIDSDKNIYVAGYADNGANGDDWLVQKYGSDGDLCDSSGTCNEGWGGGDGMVFSESLNTDMAKAISIDTDRNIYVAGYIYTGASNDDWQIRKYDPAGVLCDGGSSCAAWGDSGSGKITEAGVGPVDEIMAIAIDDARNIVVAGYQGSNAGDWAIKKYDPDGAAASNVISVGTSQVCLYVLLDVDMSTPRPPTEATWILKSPIPHQMCTWMPAASSRPRPWRFPAAPN